MTGYEPKNADGKFSSCSEKGLRSESQHVNCLFFVFSTCLKDKAVPRLRIEINPTSNFDRLGVHVRPEENEITSLNTGWMYK